MDSQSTSLSLSKNVLAMKFMQRSRSKVPQTNVPELITEEKWKYDITAETSGVCPTMPVVQRVGLSACRAFGYGRISYQGFNEEVEKIMRRKKNGNDGEKMDSTHEVSVSDEAMASSLANTITNKFSKKKGKKRARTEIEEDNNEEHNSDEDGDEGQGFEISDDTAKRIADIKRRVNELLGEDD